MARKVNVAQVARIHTIQWTEDLLQHPALQEGMHADWYGFLGQKLKMYLMRLSHRHPYFTESTRIVFQRRYRAIPIAACAIVFKS